MGQDLGVALCKHTAPLALQRPGHNSGPAALRARCHHFVNELDDLI
jgi:hypothetical protein